MYTEETENMEQPGLDDGTVVCGNGIDGGGILIDGLGLWVR